MIRGLSRKARRLVVPRPPAGEPFCRCGSGRARHRQNGSGACLDCPCHGFALTACDELDLHAARTPRVELVDGITGERRAPRIRLDGPILRVRRQRLITIGPRAGELLPGWRWAVWDGCALFAHGEADSWAAAHARGGAALDQAVTRARARAEAGIVVVS